MTVGLNYLKWKRTWRSTRLGTGILARVFMVFFILYFGAIFLVFGLFMDEMAKEFNSDADMFFVAHQYIFYYLIFELGMRIIFQEISEVRFNELILHPIKKSTIVRKMLNGTIFSIFNLLPLFFILPFALVHVRTEFGIVAATAWIISAICLHLINNFIGLRLKQWLASNPALYVIPFLSAGLIYWLDTSGILPLSIAFHYFMDLVNQYFAPASLLILIVVLAYRLMFNRLRKQAYLSGIGRHKPTFFESINFNKVGKKGFFGMVLRLNLQLIFRNKRIRTQVLFGCVFILYGLYLYTRENFGTGFNLFWGLYMTGVLMIQITPYIWSFQGNYVELLWSLPIPLKEYIATQYNFLALACLVTAVPSFFYVFINPDVLLINAMALLFNVGINIPILLVAACYNKKKLEINTSGTFNMQGVSGQQFIFVFVVLLSPILIYSPFGVFGYSQIGLYVVGGLGVLGLLLRPVLLRTITELINEKKYGLAEGYRSNG